MDQSYKNICIEDYDYLLDDNRIAKYPLEKRDSSKLLIYKNETISRSTFNLIDNEFESNDLLIYNNTKVIQARLNFFKKSGAKIEVFLLNPVNPTDYQLAFVQTHKSTWNCIVGNIKRWKGDILRIDVPKYDLSLEASMLSRTADGALVNFSWPDKGISFAQIVEEIGQVPIPPYLNRSPEDEDKQRYQTVYANPEGSVAAPTAGLHFTDQILKQILSKGVTFGEVTLHVGAGTFKPVKSDTIGGHEMHTEQIIITRNLVEKLTASKGKICAVGTTSLRTLESLYWLGVKLLNSYNTITEPFVGQWDPYTYNINFSKKESLNAIIRYMDENSLENLSAKTQMIILPGYNFKIVDTLVTNFHQPRSTLLLLVAAFIGENWKQVYQYALDNDFRFLSYGDSSILSINNTDNK